MAFKFYVLLACLSVSTVSAQLDRAFNFDFNLDNTDNNQVSSTTPVPILRYIDTQNPDGSYTFGYEGGDGTYKIETRYATGEVKGKYGYYDDTGLLREVEYGATPEGGFEPTGSGLDIPDTPRTETPRTEDPITTTKNGRKVKLVRRKRPQQTVNKPTVNGNDPRVQLPASRRRQNQPTSAASEVRRLPIRPTAQPQNNNQFSNFQPQPLTLNTRPQQQQQRRPAQPRQPVARPQPRPQPQPQPQQFAAQPFQVPANRFDGHPAQNIDLNTGSYTISYGR